MKNHRKNLLVLVVAALLIATFTLAACNNDTGGAGDGAGDTPDGIVINLVLDGAQYAKLDFDGISDVELPYATQDGREIDGWYHDDAYAHAYNPEIIAAGGEFTLYGKTAAAKHKVSFVLYDERTGVNKVLGEQYVTEGEAAQSPLDLNGDDKYAVDGFEITGWDKAFDNIVSDTVINAVFNYRKYTLNFILGGITESITLEYGSEFSYGKTLPEGLEIAAVKDGDGSDVQFPYVMPSKDVTLTAALKVKDFALTVKGTGKELFYLYRETLTAEHIATDGITYAYEWKRGDETITSANGREYVTGALEKGETYTVTVIATYSGNEFDDVAAAERSAAVTLSVKAPERDKLLISGIEKEYVYTQKAIEPVITVRYADEANGINETLVRGKDFELAYGENITVRQGGKVIITYIGAYADSTDAGKNVVEKTFEILKAEAEITFDGVPLAFGNKNLTADDIVRKLSYTNTDSGVKITLELPDGGIKNAGKYNLNATLAESANYKEATLDFEIEIKPFDITSGGEAFKVTIETATYDGAAQKPNFNVILNGTVIAELEDSFDKEWTNNVNAGTAELTLTGKGNFTGSVSVAFTVNPLDVSNSDVTIGGLKPSYDYNDGSSIQPEISDVILNGTTAMIKDVDYTVSFGENIEKQGSVTLNFTGNYSGSVTKTFIINQGKTSVEELPTINGDAVFGGKLGDLKLDGGKVINRETTATISGTWSFENPDATFQSAGANDITVIFTPDDTNYKKITAVIALTVSKAALQDGEYEVKFGFDYTYNGQARPVPQFSNEPDSISVMKGGERIEITGWQWDKPNFLDAGKYNVTISFKNYNDVTAVFTVGKLTVDNGNTPLDSRILSGADYRLTSRGASIDVDFGGIYVSVDRNVYPDVNLSLADFEFDGAKQTYSTGGTYCKNIKADNGNIVLDIDVFVKVASVKVGDDYFTIEDALAIESTANQTLILAADTRFADRETAKTVYPQGEMSDQDYLAKYYTVNANATLLVPYSVDGSTAVFTESAVECVNSQTPKGSWVTLFIDGDIDVYVKGTLTVNAVRSNSGYSMGHTACWYGTLNIEASSTVHVIGGTLDCVGYVTGNGVIDAFSGKVYDVLAIKDWRGGHNAGGVWFSGIMPFIQYTLNNIETELKINNGAQYFGKAAVFASDSWHKTDAVVIDRQNSGLFRFASDSDYIIKKFNAVTGRITISAYGAIEATSLSLNISGIIKIDTAIVEFPINGNMTLIIAEGETKIINKFKLMPGAKLIVNEGAKLTVAKNGALYAYDESIPETDGAFIENNFTDSSSPKPPEYEYKDGYSTHGNTVAPYPSSISSCYRTNISADYNKYNSGSLIINGELSGNGIIAGKIGSENDGAKILLDNLILSGEFLECRFTQKGFITGKVTSTNRHYTANGVIGGVNANFENATYAFENGAWVKQA